MQNVYGRALVGLSRAINRRLLEMSYSQKRIKVRGMPKHIMIEPTSACNARCPLCPTGLGELNRPPQMMDMKLFERLIDEMYRYVYTLNLWNFGEPFLHRQIFDMIRYAQNHFVSVKVSTNGFVFYDPENIARLIDCGLDYLIVGMDGATAETFGKYRVGVDFERVLGGLRLLYSQKKSRGAAHPVVDWQFIVMRHNQHEIEQAQKLAQEMGAVFSLKTADLRSIDSLPDIDRYLPMDERLSRYTRKPEGTYDLKVERKNDCYLLWHSILVNSDGKVIPCCYDYNSDLLLGDSNQETLRQIWNGSRIQAIRRQVLLQRQALRPCAKCSVDAWPVLFVEPLDSSSFPGGSVPGRTYSAHT